mmetsp:Transcript_51458/g.124252  ORF Transcript_51458/g.124252 Transcript_51458/m.124252 type:complete len:143 (+) Transcript_51458:930-1358(+)
MRYVRMGRQQCCIEPCAVDACAAGVIAIHPYSIFPHRCSIVLCFARLYVFVVFFHYLRYCFEQYVGVASGQKDVMLLGGNILPDSLSQYLMPGNDDDHDDIDGVDVDVDDNGEGTDTVIDQEQQNDDDGDGDESNSNKKMAS